FTAGSPATRARIFSVIVWGMAPRLLIHNVAPYSAPMDELQSVHPVHPDAVNPRLPTMWMQTTKLA
ncbi:MAG: hypothetical protein ACLGJD_09735, partial [Gammaproteobacteria bacterium]